MLLGGGSGAIIAALALGLVLTFRSSGVVNLGYGGVAGYVAYTYSSLRTAGAYPVPAVPNPLSLVEGLLGLVGVRVDLPDIPPFIDFGDGLAAPAAWALSLLTAAAIGLLMHFCVFRPLRYAPPLAKVVASVGVLLVLQSLVVLRFGSRPLVASKVLPEGTVEWVGVELPLNRYLLAAAALLVAAGLWALFRFTRYGIATRAAAEDERAATLLGYSPDFQAGTSWVMASVLAGVVGILVSPIVGLGPATLALLVIPALGAALLARFSSFGIAALAGLAIGMVQSEVFFLETTTDWFPKINLQQSLPFLVIIVAVFVRGSSLPTRETVVVTHLPEARARALRWRLIVPGLLVVLVACVVLPYNYRDGLNNSMIGVIFCLSFVVITGYVGQISLVQNGLAGIAAFGVATFFSEGGLPLPLAAGLAVGSSVLVGVAVAVPTLRTRGATLAIVTLASAVAIQELLFQRQGWFGTRVTKPVDAPTLFGIDFGPGSPFFGWDGKIPSPAFGVVLFAVTSVLCLAVARLRRSALGETMLAVRANERAAASAGIDVPRVKVVAFAISAGIAGVAGVMSAFKFGAVNGGSYNIIGGLTLLAFAYLGGIATVSGALWGGSLSAQGIGVVVGEEILPLGRYTSYLAGILLIFTAVQNSEGLDGAFEKSVAKYSARLDRVRDRWAGRASVRRSAEELQVEEVP